MSDPQDQAEMLEIRADEIERLTGDLEDIADELSDEIPQLAALHWF